MKIRAIVFFVLICMLMSVGAGCLYLIPGGQTIGVKAYSDGLLITAVDPNSPAKKSGLREGDVIKTVGGKKVSGVKILLDAMASGNEMNLGVERSGEQFFVTVKPEEERGAFTLGAYVRSTVAGIGTVTYYDLRDGSFGALGHGITDASGENLLPISGGEVIPSAVEGIVPSVRGRAGRLNGEFEPDKLLGTVKVNTQLGIFGQMKTPDELPLPVAEPEEITAGKAQIRANLSGKEVCDYDIEIVKIYDRTGNSGREMLLRVTDNELLKKTGGIVQGMSGSPIIQNGKLIGAVTHVLVNSPELGYGVFVNSMLQASERAA